MRHMLKLRPHTTCLHSHSHVLNHILGRNNKRLRIYTSFWFQGRRGEQGIHFRGFSPSLHSLTCLVQVNPNNRMFFFILCGNHTSILYCILLVLGPFHSMHEVVPAAQFAQIVVQATPGWVIHLCCCKGGLLWLPAQSHNHREDTRRPALHKTSCRMPSPHDLLKESTAFFLFASDPTQFFTNI